MGHSTSSALIDFIHKVITSIDNGEILLGLFLDLSKAFDTLDHKILICLSQPRCSKWVPAGIYSLFAMCTLYMREAGHSRGNNTFCALSTLHWVDIAHYKNSLLLLLL